MLDKIWVLQTRWQIERFQNRSCLVYYGLRNPPYHTQMQIFISDNLAKELKTLDGKTKPDISGFTPEDGTLFTRLVDEAILVEPSSVCRPATPENKQRCTRCIVDDYLVPGVEFNEEGVCAFCQCYDEAERQGVNTSDLSNYITEDELGKIDTDSRFDVMVLFTGGKDSSFVLWYLAKKLNKRVLAVTWDMPYNNDAARENIKRAKLALKNVEFVEWTVPLATMRQAMASQLENVGLPCLCPMVAWALFYPLAVKERIPYIVSGVEEVQTVIMTHIFGQLKNEGKAGASRLKTPRDMTLGFLELLLSAPFYDKVITYGMAFPQLVASARQQLPQLYQGLQDCVERFRKETDQTIPLIKRLKTNESYGKWTDVIKLLNQEIGWQMPAGQKSRLHTSCRIEEVKDWLQLKSFRAMETAFYPQSVVELGAAVYFGLISYEEGLMELADLGYYSEPAVLGELRADLNLDKTS